MPDDLRTRENTSITDTGHHLLGPLFAYTFLPKAFPKFNRPTARARSSFT